MARVASGRRREGTIAEVYQMLNARQRRTLLVEAHHFVRGTAERIRDCLAGERPPSDLYLMPDRELSEDELHGLLHLDAYQRSGLAKVLEGTLAAELFEYLALFDGTCKPCGDPTWQGLELSPAAALAQEPLQSDFYTVYRDMRRFETGDRTHDVREGKPLITKLS